MLKRLLTVAGLLSLAATSAHAADGGSCASVATDYDVLTRGRMVPIWCVVLCDNRTTDTACTNFDMNSLGGLPDVVVFELHEVDIDAAGGTDCTAGVFTLASSPTPGLTVASIENVFALGTTTALTKGGTTKLNMDQRTSPIDRYVMATPAVDATCTADGFDVLMIGYEEKQ